MEKTFVMIKPDGYRKRLFKEIMERFLENGLSISDVSILSLSKDLVDEHYKHLLERDFYPRLQSFMLSGPVIIMIVSGDNAIKRVRELVGSTNPKEAQEGTIRGDFGDKENTTCNVIHASDSMESVKEEINRFGAYQKKLVK